MLAQLSPRERFGYAIILALVLFACGVVGARYLQRPASIVVNDHSAKADPEQPAGKVLVHVAGAVKKPGLYEFAAGERVNSAIERAQKLPNADLDRVNLAARLEDGSQLLVPYKASETPFSLSEHTELVPIETYRLPSTGKKLQPTKKPKRDTSPPPTYASTAANAEEPIDEPTEAQPSSYIGGSNGASYERSTKSESEDKLPPGSISINGASQAQLERLPGVGPSTATKIIEYRRINGRFKSIDELLAVKGIGEAKLRKLRPYVRL